jgi:hypothetical protein
MRSGAQPADIVWTNTAGGNWNVINNWWPNQVPSTNDVAWITNNGTYIVTLNANATLSGLGLGGTSGTQTFNHATYTLTLNGPGNVSSKGVYSLASGAALTGSGALTLDGRLNWTGGTIGGAGASLVVTANGGLTISGSIGKSLYGTLVNSGPATWTGADVRFFPTALFSNTPSGSLDLLADNTAFSVQSGSPSFVNAGTLRKNGGTGTTTLLPPCVNAYSVQVNTGTLALTLDDSTGSFNMTAGTTLSVSGAATLAPSASITGAGNFTVTGGTITNNGTCNVSGTNSFSNGTAVFGGDVTMTNNALILSGGTVVLKGTGTVTPSTLSLSSGSVQGSLPVSVSGAFSWTGGAIGGTAGASLVVTANGGLTMSGVAKVLYGTLVNNGPATWTGADVRFFPTALFSNTPSGSLDLLADNTAFSVQSGSPSFVNAGTLRKNGGTGTTTLLPPCVNAYSVQVNTGTLALTLDDSSGGFKVAAGTTLSLSGTATLAASSSISGAGNFTVTGGTVTNNGTCNVSGTNSFSGGTVVFAGDVTITNTPLVVNGGTVVLSGTGTVAPSTLSLSSGSVQGSLPVGVPGAFSWTGGAVGGTAGATLVVTANGGLTMSGAAKTLYGRLVNNGLATWSGADIHCYPAALFSNTPNGSLDLTADNTAFSVQSGSPTFANAGTLRKTVGSGTTAINPGFRNSGTVQANTGTLSFGSSFLQTSGLVHAHVSYVT